MEESLQQWATHLTSRHKLFSHDQPLAPHHFAILMRDKRLQPCLSYLLHHVCSPSQMKLVKLNLKHAHIRKSLKEQCGESSDFQDYLRLKASIVDTRAAIAAEVAEIKQLNQRKEELRQAEVEARRKAALVRLAHQDKEKLAQHYSLWSTQLGELIHGDIGREKSGTKLSLAVKRRVHDNLIDLGYVHHAIISGKPDASKTIHQQKEHLWASISGSVEEWGPKVMLEAVIGETQEGQHAMRSLLQEVDLARDAHDLRVKCESDGTFIDDMNPGGVVESVRELLTQMNGAHVRLYIQAHRNNQTALSLTRALTTLTNNITSVVKRGYEDEEVAAAVISLMKANIALAGERAALASFQTLTASLQDQADMAARIRSAVRDKYSRIVNFEKKIQDGVENIQCLAKSVRGGRENIKELITQLKSYMTESLSCITFPTPFSPNTLGSESEVVAALPLAYLLTTEVESLGWKRKVNMSTTPLMWHNPEVTGAGWEAVSQLCDGMRFWDSVFEAACKRMHLTTTLHCQMERLTGLREAMGTSKKHSQAISSQDTKELLQQVEENDQKLEEEVTAMLEDSERQLTKGTQLITKFTQHMSDWWEQPAKNIELKEL